MLKIVLVRLGIVASLALRPPAIVADAPPSTATPVTAESTVIAFHDALRSGDAEAAMMLLAPDAVILEQGSREKREEYREHHLQADIEFARLVETRRTETRLAVAGDVAWVSSKTSAGGIFRGKPVSSLGVELVVLSREQVGWLIRAIHWSSR